MIRARTKPSRGKQGSVPRLRLTTKTLRQTKGPKKVDVGWLWRQTASSSSSLYLSWFPSYKSEAHLTGGPQQSMSKGDLVSMFVYIYLYICRCVCLCVDINVYEYDCFMYVHMCTYCSCM